MALVAAWCPGRSRTLGRAANTRNNVILGRSAGTDGLSCRRVSDFLCDGGCRWGERFKAESGLGAADTSSSSSPSTLVDLVASCPSKAVKRCSRPVLSIEGEVRWNGRGVVGGRAAHRPSGVACV